MRSELGRTREGGPRPARGGGGLPHGSAGVPHGLAYANYEACANSDSPSEPSLANSGAIRSDGRKNPSAY